MYCAAIVRFSLMRIWNEETIVSAMNVICRIFELWVMNFFEKGKFDELSLKITYMGKD